MTEWAVSSPAFTEKLPINHGEGHGATLTLTLTRKVMVRAAHVTRVRNVQIVECTTTCSSCSQVRCLNHNQSVNASISLSCHTGSQHSRDASPTLTLSDEDNPTPLVKISQDVTGMKHATVYGKLERNPTDSVYWGVV